MMRNLLARLKNNDEMFVKHFLTYQPNLQTMKTSIIWTRPTLSGLWSGFCVRVNDQASGAYTRSGGCYYSATSSRFGYSTSLLEMCGLFVAIKIILIV